MFFTNNIILYLIISISSSNLINSQETYDITIENKLILTDLKNTTNYLFNLKTDYPQELKIEISEYLLGRTNFYKRREQSFDVKECESDLLCEKIDYIDFNNAQMADLYYPDENFYDVGIYIPYIVKNYNTKKVIFEFHPITDIKKFSITFYSLNPYDLSRGVTLNISKLFDSSTYYFFILGEERFKRINITINIKLNWRWWKPLQFIYIKELKNKTHIYNSTIYDNDKNYYKRYEEYDTEDGSMYKYNIAYDIKIGSIILISLSSEIAGAINFSINYNIEGEIIEFDSNHIIKDITNLKINYPYYFFTKISQYQTSIITFTTKYIKYLPFDSIDIFEFENKTNIESKFIKEHRFSYYKQIENDELTIVFSYKEDNVNITDLSFRIEPKYDLDFLYARNDIINGPYFLYNGETQIFKDINSGYDLYFWIKISQFKKLKINLNINYSEKNPINSIDIYEYYSTYIFSKYNKYENHSTIFETNNNTELFTSLSTLVEYDNTNYILLKIHPEEYIKYLKINIIIYDVVFYLKDGVSKNIADIKANNKYCFLINANIYNKIFVEITLEDQNVELFDSIYIHEYEKENNLTYIKSTKQKFEKIKIENEFKINIDYKSICPYTKYVGLMIESKYSINYLVIKIDIGGGYYEFNKNKNISKIIAGSIYYIQINLLIFQKINMNITINDININPFTYANIYEMENRITNSYKIYNKCYNQTISNKMKSHQLIEYFSYSIDNFNTNYLLIELIPNMDVSSILIEYEITNSYYKLSNFELKNLTKIIPSIPYYYFIYLKQYEQVKINLITNYLNNTPFEFIEIYELSDHNYFTSINQYNNKTIEFINDNNNNLISSISLMIDSFYTKSIIVKIKSNYELEYLNVKMDFGGGAFTINKGTIENITNLYLKFSYYFFVFTSQGEKLNFKLTMKSNEKNKHFHPLNIYELSNKNTPFINLPNTKGELDMKLKNNKLISFLSYETKKNSTNFVVFETIPYYNINYLECLIDIEKREDDSSSFSIVNILLIILVIVVIITTIIFIIYIKRVCMKSSSSSIEEITKDNGKEKKFELALLPIDPSSSAN